MIIAKPTELLKSKYIKRWKGKGGKWVYEYAKPSEVRGRVYRTEDRNKKVGAKKSDASNTKPTMKVLNDYVKKTYGEDYDFHKGNGYFYFMGPAGDWKFPDSIATPSLKGWNMDEWKQVIDDTMEDAGVAKKK